MCLIKKLKDIQTAKEPIKVYKVLGYGNCAPFRNDFKYHQGLNFPVISEMKMIGYLRDFVIGGGYLHAYTTLNSALMTIEELLKYKDKAGCEVVEMWIPAGAKYWVGVDGDVAAEVLFWDTEV